MKRKDYTSIKTFNDACKALGIEFPEFGTDLSTHIKALIRLEIISAAIQGNDRIVLEKSNFISYYMPYFQFKTMAEGKEYKAKVKVMIDDVPYYFVCPEAQQEYIDDLDHNPNLFQKTRDKAEYFGNQFIGLWAEYYQNNYKIIDQYGYC